MAAEYCTVQDVSNFMQLQHDNPQDITSDVAIDDNVIPVASTRRYVVNMSVHVYDDDNPDGEERTIASIQAETSITLNFKVLNAYTTAQNAKVRVLNGFTEATRPSYTYVGTMIEQAQEEIDGFCRTTWLSAGKAITAEYHDYRPTTDKYGRHRDYTDRGRTYVRFRPIVSWDKIELWIGNTYDDLVASFTEGRNNDYWTEDDKGTIHYANKYPYRVRKSVRVDYTYGHASIPNDIKMACIMLTAAQMVLFEDNTIQLEEGGESINHDIKYKHAREDAYKILVRHQEYYVHD